MSSNSTEVKQGSSIRIVNQYLKSINLENFIFPEEILLSQTEKPVINVDLSAQASAIEDNLFEVQISGQVNALYSESKTKLFSLSFSYGSVFNISNTQDAEKEILLLVYCPTVMFPFVRRIVSDITADSGFPAVMIEMVDFGKLYQENLERRNKK